MKKNCCNFKLKLAIIAFVAALLCLCFLSAKFTLIIVAIALIAVGIWLLKCK